MIINRNYVLNSSDIIIKIKKTKLIYLLNQYKLNFFSYCYNKGYLNYFSVTTKKLFNLIPIKTSVTLSRHQVEERYNQIGFENIFQNPSIPFEYKEIYNTYSLIALTVTQSHVPIRVRDLQLFLDVCKLTPSDLDKYSKNQDE